MKNQRLSEELEEIHEIYASKLKIMKEEKLLKAKELKEAIELSKKRETQL